MPELSRFYGIVVKMYYGDHLPPHFHAEYGAQEALLQIDTLAVIAGRLPPRATAWLWSGPRYTNRSYGKPGKEPRAFSHRERLNLSDK